MFKSVREKVAKLNMDLIEIKWHNLPDDKLCSM
jgi:hypothetical protein